MIWLAFFEFITILPPIAGVQYMVEIHSLLGVLIVILAFYNVSMISKTEAPDRIKRILKATAGMATFQGILGIALYLNIMVGSGIIEFLHLVISLTIIAQASSAATGYDMWEEKEFVQTDKTEETPATSS